MSLINQMLRDLEKRNGEPAQTQPISQHIHVTAAPSTSKLPVLGWNLLAALAVCGIYVGYQHYQTSAKPVPLAATAVAPNADIMAKDVKPQTPIIAASNSTNPIAIDNTPAKTTPETQPTPTPSIAPASAVETVKPSPEPALPQTTVAATTALPPAKPAAPKLKKIKPVLPAVSEPVYVDSDAEEDADTPQPILKISKANSHTQQADTLYRQALTSANGYTAVPALEQALRLNPQHLNARLLLAKTLHNMGQVYKTAQFLDESLVFFPSNLQFINTRAQIHLQQKNPRAALAVLQRIDPDNQANEAYLSLLAAAYQQQGIYAQAGKIYQRLADINPRKAENWLGLALAAEKTFDNRLAIAAYQQALAINTLKPSIVNYINQRLNDIR